MGTPTPLRAVRARCLACVGSAKDVRDCEEPCDLNPFRLGRGVRGKGSILKAIRSYCLWCCDGQPSEVRLCPSVNCALYPYRDGRRQSTRTLTAEQRAAIGQRLSAARAARAARV